MGPGVPLDHRRPIDPYDRYGPPHMHPMQCIRATTDHCTTNIPIHREVLHCTADIPTICMAIRRPTLSMPQ